MNQEVTEQHPTTRTGLHRSALIVNAYSFRNAGDAAIMLSTVQLLRECGFDRVVISTRYTEDASQYARWGVEVVDALVPFATTLRGGRGRVLRLALDTARVLGPVLLPGAVHRPGPLRTVARRLAPGASSAALFDVVVVAGGGYLYTARRTVNLSLAHSCLTMLVARRLAALVVSMPQSIGPVNRRLDSFVIRTAFGGLTAHVREELSLSASRRPPHLSRIVLVPDVVFLGQPAPSTADRNDPVPTGVDSERTARTGGLEAPVDARPVARVVVMTWSWSTSVDGHAQERYVGAMAQLCDLLDARGYRVVLGGHSNVPEHDQDDVEVCTAVAERVTASVHIDGDCDVAHLHGEYGRSAVVIGTRLHACIMALAVGTPAVALAYQEKAIGVAAGLGGALPVFRVDDFDPVDVMRAVESLSPTLVARVVADAQASIRAAYGPLLGPT